MTRSAYTLLWLSVGAMCGCANLPESSEPVEPSSEHAQTPIADLTCEELTVALAAAASSDAKSRILTKMRTDTARHASSAAYRHTETTGSTIAAVHGPPAYAGSKSDPSRKQRALKREFAERCEQG